MLKQPMTRLHAPIYGIMVKGDDGKLRRLAPACTWHRRDKARPVLNMLALDQGLAVRLVIIGHQL